MRFEERKKMDTSINVIKMFIRDFVKYMCVTFKLIPFQIMKGKPATNTSLLTVLPHLSKKLWD